MSPIEPRPQTTLTGSGTQPTTSGFGTQTTSDSEVPDRTVTPYGLPTPILPLGMRSGHLSNPVLTLHPDTSGRVRVSTSPPVSTTLSDRNPTRQDHDLTLTSDSDVHGGLKTSVPRSVLGLRHPWINRHRLSDLDTHCRVSDTNTFRRTTSG